jgi:DNA-binding NarL/FixJ family response regulator
MENSTEQKPVVGLLVTADLIFSTKITGTARAMGLEMQVLASPRAAVERLGRDPIRCVFLDLSLSSLTPETIHEIVVASSGVPILAFGSHVDAARLQAASDAGCTEVMPRSRLATTLPQLIEQYLRN